MRRGPLFVALACLLLLGCEPPLPKEYNGWWTGQSESGNRITFQIHDGVVQDLRIDMGGGCGGSLTWSGTARVRKQQLNIDVGENRKLEGAKSLQLTGTFRSDHEVSGTVSAVSLGSVTNPLCSGMVTGTWSGVRDAWRKNP